MIGLELTFPSDKKHHVCLPVCFHQSLPGRWLPSHRRSHTDDKRGKASSSANIEWKLLGVNFHFHFILIADFVEAI